MNTLWKVAAKQQQRQLHQSSTNTCA